MNIKDDFESGEMLQLLQGLCQANCWGHFDGMDLLSYDTLSILTTQLQQVCLDNSCSRCVRLTIETGVYRYM